jgi:aminoglycoside phosphotransferase (APT) family kinase protein
MAIVMEFSQSTSFLPYVAAGNSIEGLNVRLAEAIASYQSIPISALPASMERPASWDAYMTKRINSWREASNHHVESLPVFHYVAEWLDAHRPPPAPLVLMHGDFQCANVMVTADGNIEVIDWELAGIGDPREDIGYFKAVSQASPPDLLGDDGIEGFCARYRELTGLNELQVNPATVAYFLVLGVVGTVEQLMQGGAAWAKGENHLFNSVFNLSSVLFGQSMWLNFLGQLSEPMKQIAAAANGGK